MRILQSLLWFSRTARTFGLPLIHIRAQYTCEGSPWLPFFKELNPEKPAYEATVEGASFAQKEPGEIEMPKTNYDAFANTELHSLLQRSRVNHVYVIGKVTSACVLMTEWRICKVVSGDDG